MILIKTDAFQTRRLMSKDGFHYSGENEGFSRYIAGILNKPLVFLR